MPAVEPELAEAVFEETAAAPVELNIEEPVDSSGIVDAGEVMAAEEPAFEPSTPNLDDDAFDRSILEPSTAELEAAPLAPQAPESDWAAAVPAHSCRGGRYVRTPAEPAVEAAGSDGDGSGRSDDLNRATEPMSAEPERWQNPMRWQNPDGISFEPFGDESDEVTLTGEPIDMTDVDDFESIDFCVGTSAARVTQPDAPNFDFADEPITAVDM
ncbi:MAG: hypothetical protein IPK97_07630 [Ahniella sp.]|nr:hypothetical protein [Ahniella sp.]